MATASASVMTHRSTSETSPTNFLLISSRSSPHTNATTADSVSRHPGGRGPGSAASFASSLA